MLKLSYFPIKKYFLWLFSCFFILICFKTGEMCFQYAKELFVLPIIAFLGFLQKSSKGYIFLKKIRKSKKGKIMILDSNFNIKLKQETKVIFLNVHLRQPPFSS